jgi:NADH-quinone oxidoreductase subunit E
MADLHPDNPYAKERFADASKAVAFPPDAKARFDYILTRYPTTEAALLPTLHLAQEVWGWISPEVVHYVGELLNLSPATVFGVVSFYNMYNQKPVGKYKLNVCTNLPCQLRDGARALRHLEHRLGIGMGETTRDGLFTLQQAECLGACADSPVMLVNDRVMCSFMSNDKLDQLIDGLKKAEA